MINKLHLAMIELYRGDAKRIQHFCKVHSYAKLIAETENVDKKCLFIIEAAALTHDIGIHFCEEKYGNCNGKLQEKEGPAIAEKLLGELGFDQDVSGRVPYLIAHHHTYDNIDEIDYQILVEADFLVNIMEDGLSKDAALKAYHNILKPHVEKGCAGRCLIFENGGGKTVQAYTYVSKGKFELREKPRPLIMHEREYCKGNTCEYLLQ